MTNEKAFEHKYDGSYYIYSDDGHLNEQVIFIKEKLIEYGKVVSTISCLSSL
jgi:hypothetical protein